MLAYGMKPLNPGILTTIVLTILTLYSGFFAALIWNDITDVDIDIVSHPDRPIPSGRISSKKFFAVALFFSAATFLFSFLVSLWCFLLVGAAALFVAFHNKYLKKIVKLPAYSEIFTPIQWVVVPIFGFLAVSGSNIQHMILLAVFTYFADNAHDLPEGIHDAEGDRISGVRTYATSFGEKNAARISFAMFFISGILGVVLFLKTILTPVFLVPFLCVWVYTLYHSFKLLKAEIKDMREIGVVVGRKGFNYFLIAYDLIFLDVLIQMLINNL
jgi:geranylgeranylglycerol-phosphate geranylgeranyltransferase